MRARRGLAIVAVGAGLGIGAGCTPGPIEVATLPTDSLTDSMVAHWALDEDVGTVADDGSGNARTGFIAGPGWIPGQFGSALHFSGATYMSAAGIPPATLSYSVSAWALIQPYEIGAPIENMISTETPGGGWALFTSSMGQESYSFRYLTNTGQGYATVSCSCVVTGSWTHLAAVVDGDASTLTLYVNGVPTTVPTGGSMILPGSSVLYLARSSELNPTFPLTGALDDVVIYSRALVAEEVAELGNAAAPNPQ